MGIHLERARQLIDLRRYDLAEKELRAELAVEPDQACAHAMLASCLVNRNQTDEAEEEAKEAIRLAPEWAYSYYILGFILKRKEKWTEAIAAMQEALRLDPRDADYWAEIARILLRDAQYRKALDAAAEGLKIDPEHIDCIDVSGWALSSQGQIEQARAVFESALKINPENQLTHSSLGRLLLYVDKRDAAEHLQEALRLDPTNQTSADLFNWVRDEEIRAELEEADILRERLRNRTSLAWGILESLILCIAVVLAAKDAALCDSFKIVVTASLVIWAFSVFLHTPFPLRAIPLDVLRRLDCFGVWELLRSLALSIIAMGVAMGVGLVLQRGDIFFVTLGVVFLIQGIAHAVCALPRWLRRLVAIYTIISATSGLAGSFYLWSGQLDEGVVLSSLFLLSSFLSGPVSKILSLVFAYDSKTIP